MQCNTIIRASDSMWRCGENRLFCQLEGGYWWLHHSVYNPLFSWTVWTVWQFHVPQSTCIFYRDVRISENPVTSRFKLFGHSRLLYHLRHYAVSYLLSLLCNDQKGHETSQQSPMDLANDKSSSLNFEWESSSRGPRKGSKRRLVWIYSDCFLCSVAGLSFTRWLHVKNCAHSYINLNVWIFFEN